MGCMRYPNLEILNAWFLLGPQSRLHSENWGFEEKRNSAFISDVNNSDFKYNNMNRNGGAKFF